MCIYICAAKLSPIFRGNDWSNGINPIYSSILFGLNQNYLIYPTYDVGEKSCMDIDSNKNDSNKKKRLWEEINSLTHIGRTANEIEQTLSTMGYDKSLLKEILTFSFMKSLIYKEEMFLRMQQSANNQAAVQVEKEKYAVTKQKNQEQQIQYQKMKEEQSRQDESNNKSAEDVNRRIDFGDQIRRDQYQMKVNEGQAEARQQAHRQIAEEACKKQKQEEQMHLRYMAT